jgi:hypothetical protein
LALSQQIETLLSNENINGKNGLGFFIVKDLANSIHLSINISSIKGEKPPLH